LHWETPDENDCHWRRAGRCGHAVLRDQITALINPNGEQYDSRAGIAGYYRYGPRNVAELCDDDEHQVKVPTVRVHPSAYDRLARWVRDYEPVSLKGPFTVGGVPQIPADPEALEQAWDIVWWRRLVYFSTLGLTGFLLLFAVRLVIPQADCIWISRRRGWARSGRWSRGCWARLQPAGSSPVGSGWSRMSGRCSAGPRSSCPRLRSIR